MYIDRENELRAFEKLWDGYSIKDACMVSGLSVDKIKAMKWGIVQENTQYQKPIYSKSNLDLPLDWQFKKRKKYLSSQINAMLECLRYIKKLIPYWEDKIGRAHV